MAEARARLGRLLARARSVRLGAEERRLLDSPLFDEEWYSLQVGRALRRRAAVRHYLEVGVARGHHPHPLFDPAYVRSQYGPGRQRRLGAGDPLGLYLRRETFHVSTHPLFDLAGYLARAPEAASHPGGPTVHYLEVGAAAGVPANDWLDGDLTRWLAAHRSVAAARLASPPDLAEAEPVEGDPAIVSVVVVTAGDGVGVPAVVEAALGSGADDGRVELVLWDDGTRAEVAAALDALPERLPGVRVLHPGAALGASRATNLAVGHARGATVVLLHDDTVLPAGWLDPLLAPLGDPAVLGAGPVLLTPERLVESAGMAFSPDGAPHRFLHGFPEADARAADGLEFAAVSGAALAVRRSQLQAVGGLDPALEGEAAAWDLCRRFRRADAGSFRVVADVVALHARRHGDDDHAESYLRKWADEPHPSDDAALWAAAGFRVVGHEAGEPVLEREARFRTAPRPLRWAVKNPAPARSDAWGDIHYADGLADGLRALGQEVVVDRHETFERATAHHDDVAVVLRGPVPARSVPEHPTLAWVISHPDTVTVEEARGYDAVFAASAGWARRRSDEWGLAIEPLLQATDPDRFRPDSAVPDSGPDVLFVGSTRGEFRSIVRDALDAGLEPAIYGVGWEEFLRPEQVRARYLDNARLSAAYRAAGVVLNDHFEDMRREGFMSNRLFDAVASGARVVSDDVAGLAEVFGDAVKVYRDAADLRRLVTGRHELFADEPDRVEFAHRVRAEHSFRARAEVLLAAAHRALASRGG